MKVLTFNRIIAFLEKGINGGTALNAKNRRRVALGGMFAALIALTTAFVRLPLAGGYLHPGDAAIALAGVALGPYAAAPAALGSLLADLLGYPQYALFSLAIKGLLGLCAGAAGRRSGKAGRAVLLLAGCAVLTGGYFAADCLLGGVGMALTDLPWNALQAALFLVTGVAARAVMPQDHFARKTEDDTQN